MNITNYGNTRINISLDAYGSSPGDNLSMTCNNSNIPIEHQKFNLTTSSAGPLDLNEILNNYTNLSTNIIIGHLNLSQRTNDLVNDANKSTYWRVYAPYDVGGNCTGFTILGATTGEAT